MYVPPTIAHGDVNVVYNYFLNHLLPNEAQCFVAHGEWIHAYDYV